MSPSFTISRTSLSSANRVYETTTKDDIHLVWRISRVGQVAHAVGATGGPNSTQTFGYNSPFEEVALCLELNRRGVETTYPRAIYMSGHRSASDTLPPDTSRYESHEALLTPEGHPVLSSDHEYMVLWGYWNGPDELLAQKDIDYYRPINVQEAVDRGAVTRQTCERVLQATRQRLVGAGIEAPRPEADHILLSIDAAGRLVTGHDGLPRARLCTFDLLRLTFP
jgi:hypothetical protein